MKNTVLTLQERLFSIIRRLGEEPKRYARNPDRDFTRKRTLTPAVLIYLIVTMDEKSIWKGLLGHFRKRIDTPSASAFTQQRQKLLPSALEDMFHHFSDHLRPQKKFQGYRLLAVDGSSLKSGTYPADEDAYRPGTEHRHGWKYLIRIRDRDRKNAYGIKLPDSPEFDLPVRMTLGRLTPKQLRQHGIPVPEHYYRLPNSIPFDFLGTESADFYSFSARIVRLKRKDGKTQMLMTNLDAAQFPLSALRELYARRWGIETSFRELKYTVGLIHLHSRKSDLVLQEIFAAFTVFNFTRAAAWNTNEGCGSSKYKRRVNFAHAVYLCCELLRGERTEITGLLERALTPRRPDRLYPRPKISDNRLSAMYVSAR